MSDGVIGALVGVGGTVVGTLLGYFLSRLAAAEQWNREQAADRHGRIVGLVEEIMTMTIDASGEVFERGVALGQSSRLLTRMRVLEAHSRESEPDLARLMEELRSALPPASTRAERLNVLGRVLNVSSRWLGDASSLGGVALDDLPTTWKESAEE